MVSTYSYTSEHHHRSFPEDFPKFSEYLFLGTLYDFTLGVLPILITGFSGLNFYYKILIKAFRFPNNFLEQ